MRRLVPIAVVLAAASIALGQGVITDEDARFEFNNSTTLGSADFQPNGTTDHVFQNWWWWRVEGDSMESPATWFPANQSYVGNRATLRDRDPNGRFDWKLDVTLSHGHNAGEASLAEVFTVTNRTPDDLMISIYNYLDADVGGSAGGDSAVLMGRDTIDITDNGDLVRFSAPGSTAYQVMPWPQLLDELNDGDIDNLNNTGLPFGPGDFTGAFQWTVVIPPFEKVKFFENISVIVPEPASLGLLAIGGLCMLRRRR